jgi:lipoprotein-anchoring transpeptidase ErfK/SrfK
MSSRGCIRMRAADIEEFFGIVPRGSEVVVRASE